jgi:exodeoxyribonuclease VIII
MQNEQARKEMAKKGVSLIAALEEFNAWIGDGNNTKVWGNGASFDNAILAHAYGKTRMTLPWKFWNDRCYRTVKALNPQVAMQESGVAHHALDDARKQAIHLIEISIGKQNG